MIKLYRLLCCLVLVGLNFAVSVDIAATKHKRQTDCNFAVLDCFSQISSVQLDAARSNLTEYRIRSNTVASIRCTEPCFTAIQDFYKCQGDTDQLDLLNNYQCVQYEGTYCEPLATVELGLKNGTQEIITAACMW